MYNIRGFLTFQPNPQETIEQWKNTVPVLHSIMYSFKGWQNNENYAFPSKRCISNVKTCYYYTFYNENHPTYLYITCNKNILFVKKYLSLLWVFTDFSILLAAFWRHEQCDNAVTNSNSENARSRMVASLRGSVGTGTGEDESSTGRVWAAGIHQVTARSRLGRVLKLMNRQFL